MSLNLQNKKAIVAEINKVAKQSLFAIVADYSGVTADKITKLRKEGREAGTYMRIVRNTLMRRLVKGTPFECLKDTFFSTTMIGFSNEHPGATARLFKTFAKGNPNFKVKSAAFQGRIIPASQIDRLAILPTYKEAISYLILVMKGASTGKLVCVLTALRDQKEKA